MVFRELVLVFLCLRYAQKAHLCRLLGVHRYGKPCIRQPLSGRIQLRAERPLQRTIAMTSTFRATLDQPKRKLLAKRIRERAAYQQGMTEEERQEGRRRAYNLEQISAAMAAKKTKNT